MGKEVLERAKELLRSDDIEMVRLGARLLQDCTRKSRWKGILTECSRIDNEEGLDDQGFFPLYKWKWHITNNEIVIEDPEEINMGRGLWQQLSTGNVRVYTGTVGLKMISDAIKTMYLKPTKTKKNEQRKKQWRKQTK